MIFVASGHFYIQQLNLKLNMSWSMHQKSFNMLQELTSELCSQMFQIVISPRLNVSMNGTNDKKFDFSPDCQKVQFEILKKKYFNRC